MKALSRSSARKTLRQDEAKKSVSQIRESRDRGLSLLGETAKSVVSIGDSRERHGKHHERHSEKLEEGERGENVGCILRVTSSGVSDEGEDSSESRKTVKKGRSVSAKTG